MTLVTSAGPRLPVFGFVLEGTVLQWRQVVVVAEVCIYR